MQKLEIIIFDVEHGSCAFIKTPNGHGILVDCGRASYSPAAYLARYQLPSCRTYNGRQLTTLIISHPHDDHIEDINNLISCCPPAILIRSHYNWPNLKVGEGDYANLDTYANWQAAYNQPVLLPPIYGCDVITKYSVSPERSYELNTSINKCVNNTSIPVIVQYMGFKIVFAGDLEEEGWHELLTVPGFSDAIRNTNVLVAAHHGHRAGFCSEAMAVMGMPDLVVVSAEEGDEHLETRYSSSMQVQGTYFDGDCRRMISTRSDGSIIIHVDNAGDAIIAIDSATATISNRARKASMTVNSIWG